MLLRRLYIVANIGALGSALWISFTEGSPSAWIASVFSAAALAALFFRKIPVALLVSLKNAVDGSLLLLFVQEGRSPFILIYVFWVIYFLANTILIRHVIQEYFLYLFALTPLLFQSSRFGLYGSLSFILIVLNWYGSRLFREWIRKSEEDKKRLLLSLEEITQTHEATRSAIDLARHDVANIANRLLLEEAKVHKGTADPTEILKVSQSIISQILEKLRILKTDEFVEYELSKVVQMVASDGHVEVDVPKIFVRIRLEVFLSILFNLIANAREAYQRSFGNANGLCVKIHYSDGALFIDDNAGGFDVAKIAPGVSNKSEKGNGIFLYTLIRDAAKHKLRVRLTRLPRGTRVAIGFEDVRS